MRKILLDKPSDPGRSRLGYPPTLEATNIYRRANLTVMDPHLDLSLTRLSNDRRLHKSIRGFHRSAGSRWGGTQIFTPTYMVAIVDFVEDSEPPWRGIRWAAFERRLNEEEVLEMGQLKGMATQKLPFLARDADRHGSREARSAIAPGTGYAAASCPRRLVWTMAGLLSFVGTDSSKGLFLYFLVFFRESRTSIEEIEKEIEAMLAFLETDLSWLLDLAGT
ncbi:hypothetical protein SISNIDRAFT_464108 [Sistotremastrum niveocremeum HHB9708]|uniref:Uncharacterized protein n=1 Tax=Sistotremastrum niveocremeum HHB9708 TaxID=1314777 RepID=A0A164XA55_9AGAM|nr:hypothetical protein SISNIDRAFT_464108 [Sistotremastrum niveocremeum HHB9708]